MTGARADDFVLTLFLRFSHININIKVIQNYLCLVTGARADDLAGLLGGVAPLATGTESRALLGENIG